MTPLLDWFRRFAVLLALVVASTLGAAVVAVAVWARDWRPCSPP